MLYIMTIHGKAERHFVAGDQTRRLGIARLKVGERRCPNDQRDHEDEESNIDPSPSGPASKDISVLSRWLAELETDEQVGNE
jgi:hypothetical protein